LGTAYNKAGWQREYFADQPLDDFLNKAKEYEQQNPFSIV